MFSKQYTNIYTVTPKMTQLYNLPELQEACLNYLFPSNFSGQSSPEKSTQFTTSKTLFSLYSSLIGTSLSDWIKENSDILSLLDLSDHLQKFILFGTMNGFIRRVHEYPLRLDQRGPAKFEEQYLIFGLIFWLIFFFFFGYSRDLPVMDGETTVDQLATQLERSFLDNFFRKTNCFILLK